METLTQILPRPKLHIHHVLLTCYSYLADQVKIQNHISVVVGHKHWGTINLSVEHGRPIIDVWVEMHTIRYE